MLIKLRTFFFLALVHTSPFIRAETVMISDFSRTHLSDWQEKQFSGRTTYKVEQTDQRKILAAFSSNAASALFKEIHVNLHKTPILHWSWKIKHTLGNTNERVKAGDDYAARIYVVFSDGPFFWQTKTINYVWANQARAEEHWPNPYTSNAQMLAIQSGDKKATQWQNESRNVLQDIQTVFGKTFTEIEAIAIMTDTDQTGLTAQAWFSDIWFSDQ